MLRILKGKNNNFKQLNKKQHFQTIPLNLIRFQFLKSFYFTESVSWNKDQYI